MSRVIFEQVTKRFGDVVAVEDLSLEVHEKEFLALLGPSGGGLGKLSGGHRHRGACPC